MFEVIFFSDYHPSDVRNKDIVFAYILCLFIDSSILFLRRILDIFYQCFISVDLKCYELLQHTYTHSHILHRDLLSSSNSQVILFSIQHTSFVFYVCSIIVSFSHLFIYNHFFKRLTFKRANKSVINTKYMIILIYFHRLTYIFLP